MFYLQILMIIKESSHTNDQSSSLHSGGDLVYGVPPLRINIFLSFHLIFQQRLIMAILCARYWVYKSENNWQTSLNFWVLKSMREANNAKYKKVVKYIENHILICVKQEK